MLRDEDALVSECVALLDNLVLTRLAVHKFVQTIDDISSSNALDQVVAVAIKELIDAVPEKETRSQLSNWMQSLPETEDWWFDPNAQHSTHSSLSGSLPSDVYVLRDAILTVREHSKLIDDAIFNFGAGASEFISVWHSGLRVAFEDSAANLSHAISCIKAKPDVTRALKRRAIVTLVESVNTYPKATEKSVDLAIQKPTGLPKNRQRFVDGFFESVDWKTRQALVRKVAAAIWPEEFVTHGDEIIAKRLSPLISNTNASLLENHHQMTFRKRGDYIELETW